MKFRKAVSLSDMPAIALSFVLIGVTLGLGAYINSQIQTTAGWASTSTEYLAVQNATLGIAQLSSWLPIIAVVIAAGVVIGVLIVSFAFRRGM